MTERGEVLSLTEEAYQIIKKRIIETIYPPESFLTEASLSDDLGMSRMPIRMAIKRLQNEDWLKADFRKKIKVRSVTRKDVLEIYELRKLLEESAMKIIFETDRTWEFSHRIEEKVVRIKAAQNDPYEWEYADTEMHMELVSIFDNSRIDRIYKNNQEEFIRIGLISKKPPLHVQRVIERLYQMVQAIRENNADIALSILREDHLEAGLEMALSVVADKER